MAETLTVKGQKTKRANPKIEDMKHTAKLFFKNKIAFVGMLITAVYFIIALVDVVYPQYLGVTGSISYLPHYQVPYNLPVAPTLSKGWWYWFGTTGSTGYQLALLPTMLAALKIDLSFSIVIVFSGALIGVVLGTMAGYFGGLIDEILLRITDIFFSVPLLILAIAFTVSFYYIPDSILIALIIVWWPIYTRLARSLALSTKSQKYVEAATASGSSGIRNVFSHVLPNVLSPVFVQISLDLGTVVQLFASLVFLQVYSAGLTQNTVELGNLLVLGQDLFTSVAAGGQIQAIWWPLILPGIFLLIFTVAINLLGDGLRDVLDPRLRR